VLFPTPLGVIDHHFARFDFTNEFGTMMSMCAGFQELSAQPFTELARKPATHTPNWTRTRSVGAGQWPQRKRASDTAQGVFHRSDVL